ncbi:MAG: hypothetical protein SFW65_04200 [Alphaproteobacteria bacterium]|nr:hypothetical protein [Alphaproteobacteria bacterium]
MCIELTKFLEKLLSLQNLILFYQLSGTMVLGWALASTSTKRIVELGNPLFDFNKPYIEGQIDQRTDAQFGIIILILGYIIELAENIFEISKNTNIKIFIIIAFVLLILSTPAYLCSRKYIRSIVCNKAEAEALRKTKP